MKIMYLIASLLLAANGFTYPNKIIDTQIERLAKSRLEARYKDRWNPAYFVNKFLAQEQDELRTEHLKAKEMSKKWLILEGKDKAEITRTIEDQDFDPLKYNLKFSALKSFVDLGLDDDIAMNLLARVKDVTPADVRPYLELGLDGRDVFNLVAASRVGGGMFNGVERDDVRPFLELGFDVNETRNLITHGISPSFFELQMSRGILDMKNVNVAKVIKEYCFDKIYCGMVSKFKRVDVEMVINELFDDLVWLRLLSENQVVQLLLMIKWGLSPQVAVQIIKENKFDELGDDFLGFKTIYNSELNKSYCQIAIY